MHCALLSKIEIEREKERGQISLVAIKKIQFIVPRPTGEIS